MYSINIEFVLLLSDWVRPICLPVAADANISELVGMYGDVAGWGLTHSHDAEGATILKTVKVKKSFSTHKHIRNTINYHKKAFIALSSGFVARTTHFNRFS